MIPQTRGVLLRALLLRVEHRRTRAGGPLNGRAGRGPLLDIDLEPLQGVHPGGTGRVPGVSE